ncbi:MAG: hypothetical protein PHF86_14995 [Candidatus Nanoarchaeia archaeon]|jgi:hypothetical protein|nr:hypothetical protein [Candidatus Nanoarchaeia archaeon]
MKEFRKTQEGRFICEECNETFSSKTFLSIHNIKKHCLSPKQYYDKWIKEEGEGICEYCGKEARFIRSDTGYQPTCCREHAHKIAFKKTKQTMLNNSGVINNFQREYVKTKIKQTNVKKFGFDNPNKNKDVLLKRSNTCLKKYGTSVAMKSDIVKENARQLCFKKYGVYYSFQREDVKQKITAIILERYGVEHPSQNLSSHNKGLKTRLLIKNFNGTNITYQGSFELDFLVHYFDKLEIRNGLSFRYGKRMYHSDFYLPEFNMIVEIKSSWTLKLDNFINEKSKTVVDHGFKFILIVNKNYAEFDKAIS